MTLMNCPSTVCLEDVEVYLSGVDVENSVYTYIFFVQFSSRSAEVDFEARIYGNSFDVRCGCKP